MGILLGLAAALLYGSSDFGGGVLSPRRTSTSAGRIAFIEPERKPVQSSVTYW